MNYLYDSSNSSLIDRSDRLRDKALSQRRVLLDGEIERELAIRVVLELESIRLEGSDPIRIVVNSQGGDVSYGALIIATLRELVRSGIEVIAEVRGDADSMAAIIACSCSRIEMHRLSRLMLHGVSGITWGDVQDHEAERQEMDRITEEIVNVVSAKVSNPSSPLADRKYLLKILRDKRPTWISPSDALAAGIADLVVE
jgi:ATP-dependent Clp protease protease subunit